MAALDLFQSAYPTYDQSTLMLKLSYISNSRIPTGHAHGLQIMYMCEEFARQGVEVELVVPSKKNFHDRDPFEHYGVEPNFRITRIRVPDLLSKTRILPKVTFLLDLLFYGLALLRQPISRERVLYTRDYVLLFFLPKSSRIFLEVHDIPRWKSLFKLAASRATGFVGITTGVQEALVELGVPSEKIHIAPDAVHLSQFENPEPRESARRRLGLPLERRIAMYIGRIDGWKGTDTLFDAAKHLQEIEVVVIGAVDEKLEELSRKNPRVTFFGNRPYKELKDNQAAADVLVLPASGKHEISARYTSPLKLFSYMTSRIPIVASDVPSLREVVDEKSVFFFRADDGEDLARAIKDALAQAEEAREKARIAKELVKGYTWETRAKGIISFVASYL